MNKTISQERNICKMPRARALPTKEFQLFHDHRHHDDDDDDCGDGDDHNKSLLQKILGNISYPTTTNSKNNELQQQRIQDRRRGTTTKHRRDSFATAAQWEGTYHNDTTTEDNDDDYFTTPIDDDQGNDHHDVETNSSTATIDRQCATTNENCKNDGQYERDDDSVWEELLSSAFLTTQDEDDDEEEEQEQEEKKGDGYENFDNNEDENDCRTSSNDTSDNYRSNPQSLLEKTIVLLRRTAMRISSTRGSSSSLSSSTKTKEEAAASTKVLGENKEENNNEHGDLMVGISPDEFMKVIRTVFRQLGGAFGDLPIHKLNPLTLPYYMQAEECKKNFVWKRRKHRGMSSVSFETVHGLNDALFLAQVSFVNTVQDVKIGLSRYSGPSYELVYCVTVSKPSMPAHYLAIRRDDTYHHNDYDDIDKSSFFTFDDHDHDHGHDDSDNKKSTKHDISRKRSSPEYLDMILAVRGTKTIDDYLSDALLEMKDYRGGKTHNGVCVSGLNVYNKHKDLILRLLKLSGRDKVRLTLLGHSLGAGAAAIACIEFNENHPELIEAHSIGFGCPALLSADLSKKWAKHITTLVNESDMIPRMSGATVANLIINFLEFDYTPWMMDDLHQLSNRLLRMMPQFLPGTRQSDFERWFCEQMSKNSKRFKARNLARQEAVLFPPGRCLHMYKLPASVQCVEVPCTFFNEFDVTSTMVENHKPMSSTGYYSTLLQYLKARSGDPKRRFENDLMGLPPPANQ